MTSLKSTVLLIAILFSGLWDIANADIDGFKFLNNKCWSQNSEFGGSALQVGDDWVRITSGEPGQRRSIWFRTPQDISQFMVTYKYRLDASDVITGTDNGVLFSVQNDPDGVEALGGAFGWFGTTFGADGVSPSLAVSIETIAFTNGDNTSSGTYTDGSSSNGSDSIAPATAFLFSDVSVSLLYDGNLLFVTIDDQVNMPYEVVFSVPDLGGMLGSPTAYVGFTGGVSGIFDFGNQVISDFQFVELGTKLIGDVNLDGVVDLLDVSPFVELLVNGEFQIEADINQDGEVNLLDVGPFVDLLSGG